MTSKPTIVDLPAGVRHMPKKRRRPDIEKSVGVEVRTLRQAAGLSAVELATRTGLSNAMLSRIERGNVSPSLDTLSKIAVALNIPVGRLFASVESRSDCSIVRAGKGIVVKRFGTRSDQEYQLLGNLLSGHLFVEPYLITIIAPIKEKAAFQHTGVEFIHVISGSMVYKYGESTLTLSQGDSMLFDCNGTHGPQEAVGLPVRYLSVLVNLRT